METAKLLKCKARYVARGFNQKRGVDFEENFSPTVKMVTLRFVLSFAVQQDMKLKQLDMKTAYFNAEIDKEIFLQQPLGFEVLKNGENLVCKFEKSLYGLKQSGGNWFFILRDFLTSIGIKGSKRDICLFLRYRKCFTDYVACWVDNLVYCSREGKLYEEFEVALRKKFLVSKVSDLNWFLRMHIRRDAKKIEIPQKSSMEKLLENFGMSDAKTAFTPA